MARVSSRGSCVQRDSHGDVPSLESARRAPVSTSQGYLLGNMRLRGGPWSGGGQGALAGEWSRSRGVEVTHQGPGPC